MNRGAGIGRRLLPLLATVLAACAPAHPAVVSEDIRSSLGRTALLVRVTTERPELRVPGAAEGATAGALIAVQGQAPPFAIITAPIGALLGAAARMPADEERATVQSLTPLESRSRVADLLRQRLVAEAARFGRHVIPLEAGAGEKEGAANFRQIAPASTDSVLDVVASGYGLGAGEWGSDPPLRLFFEVDARLVRLSDGSELFRRDYRDASEAARLSDWTADGGARVRREVDGAVGRVASAVVQDFFVLCSPRLHGTTPESAEAPVWR